MRTFDSLRCRWAPSAADGRSTAECTKAAETSRGEEGVLRWPRAHLGEGVFSRLLATLVLTIISGASSAWLAGRSSIMQYSCHLSADTEDTRCSRGTMVEILLFLPPSEGAGASLAQHLAAMLLLRPQEPILSRGRTAAPQLSDFVRHIP